MKLSQLIALAAAFCIVATPVLAENSAARVSRLKGAARYSTDNKNWKALSEGDLLKSGSVIQTAGESWVDIVLYDTTESFNTVQPVVRKFSYGTGQESEQNVIRLRENTVLSLDKLFSQGTGSGNVTETQIDLRAGRIFGNVKKLSGASRYEVKLPNGVAGIRGTLYLMDATGLVTVYFGSVIVSYYDGTGQLITRVVLANERLDLNTSELKYVDVQEMPEPPSPPPTPTRTITPVTIPVRPNPSPVRPEPPSDDLVDIDNGGGNEQLARRSAK